MTSALVKTVIVAAIGLLVALYFGSLLGSGQIFIPTALATFALLSGLYVIFFRTIRLEAMILGFLLFGYIVGNRGFAQVSLSQQTPLYIGELGMLACLGLLGSRVALKRERLIPRNGLSVAIVVFLLLGAGRLVTDLTLNVNNAQTVTIIRDSAAVYYALFFFISYAIGTNPVGKRLVERCVLAGCLVLAPVFIIQFFVAPEFFSRITFHGYPLIWHKGDLTATYLAFASFFFFLQPARGVVRVLFRSLAMLFFLGLLIVTSRAAIFGYAVAAALAIAARRSRLVVAQVIAAVIALIIAAALQFGQGDRQGTELQRVTDKLESMTDISGSHSYHGEVGDYSSANNQFRMVWWQSVFDDTMRKGPILGLGFGYDLSASFLRTYYANQQAQWDVRSPHSIWLTILGRMGFMGLIVFTVVIFLVIRDAFRAARKVARGKASPNSLAFWAGALIILGSASFGVVLEGPMGGILFWSFLGLAASQQSESQRKTAPERVREQSEQLLAEPSLVSRRAVNL